MARAPKILRNNNDFDWDYCDSNANDLNQALISYGFASYGRTANEVWLTVDAIGGNLIRTIISMPCSSADPAPPVCSIGLNVIALVLNFVPLGFVVDYSLYAERYAKCGYLWTLRSSEFTDMCNVGVTSSLLGHNFGTCKAGIENTVLERECYLLVPRSDNANIAQLECVSLSDPQGRYPVKFTKGANVAINEYSRQGGAIVACFNEWNSRVGAYSAPNTRAFIEKILPEDDISPLSLKLQVVAVSDNPTYTIIVRNVFLEGESRGVSTAGDDMCDNLYNTINEFIS